MAVCTWCQREMTEHVSCSIADLHVEGVPIRRLPYRGRSSPCCGDCGAPRNGFHHPGCDMERCPRCPGSRQAITCGCRYDEDPPDDDLEGWDDDGEASCSLDGRRAIWRVDGDAVLIDHHGVTRLTER